MPRSQTHIALAETEGCQRDLTLDLDLIPVTSQIATAAETGPGHSVETFAAFKVDAVTVDPVAVDDPVGPIGTDIGIDDLTLDSD